MAIRPTRKLGTSIKNQLSCGESVSFLVIVKFNHFHISLLQNASPQNLYQVDGVAGVELAVGCGEEAGLGRHEQEVEPGRRQQPRPQLLVGGGAEQAPVERDQGEVQHSILQPEFAIKH